MKDVAAQKEVMEKLKGKYNEIVYHLIDNTGDHLEEPIAPYEIHSHRGCLKGTLDIMAWVPDQDYALGVKEVYEEHTEDGYDLNPAPSLTDIEYAEPGVGLWGFSATVLKANNIELDKDHGDCLPYRYFYLLIIDAGYSHVENVKQWVIDSGFEVVDMSTSKEEVDTFIKENQRLYLEHIADKV